VLEDWQTRALPQFAILAIAWLAFIAVSWIAYQRACNEDRFRAALWRATAISRSRCASAPRASSRPSTS